MTSFTLVTGGTGTLGSHVVPRLRDAGCRLRVLTRHSHEDGDGVEYVTGDLASGEGIDAALGGVETIVHLAGSPKGDEDKARALVDAASRSGSPHLVYISVVGADRIPVVSRFDRAARSATSPPSGPLSASWPSPGCRGPPCAPPSSMTWC